MRSAALRIAVLYTLAGVLWISLSDRILLALRGTANVEFLLFMSSAKGWLYVIITGLMLYKLIKTHTAELAESEQQYRSYFEEAPYPQWIVDRKNLLIKAVNCAAVNNYGFARDEFLKMSALDICQKPNINDSIMIFRELQPGMNDVGQSEHLKKDGSKIIVTLKIQMLKKGFNNDVLVTAELVV
ncbi:PAS domain S-box protein [Mucilaginibacter myungsuensis]|uniref:PAS domain S-box protein n=1 Tax=Mucilaginibacter myungsuensis TaxID=649104 RepID=A0A929L231_9SPHI|nr:PAS domain S-box protein [Mucilaginibacter myungsuensis]MBE9662670.1 PAS domain S-box protein [Mucilaginibacter myungsuensis]MDN3598090.1 PAS domain S-box protein [Mucilaginibacter myungsuensis]